MTSMGDVMSREELVAVVGECLRRSQHHEALAEQADADLDALEPAILKAGYDPYDIVREADEQDDEQQDDE